MSLDPREVDVPVVGGHAGVTILPLLSQVLDDSLGIHLTVFSMLILYAHHYVCYR